ncbi:MAG: recombinase family protein [Deltaproteobacteria bacterium]|nr:recombinase family protein [Deltaproteobacteria bacterium]HDM10135.1 resolvase [Desulfobacteraceae bacterium]
MKTTQQNTISPRTFAYLRVSTDGQDLDKFKSEILLFAHKKGWGNVEFVEEKVSGKVSWKSSERKIRALIENLQPGDRLIVPELSRLGRSLLEIMEILSVLKSKEVQVYDVKNGWSLNGSIESKVLAMAFSIAAEIERDLISKRSKEALAARKRAGVKQARPKGPGKSKLDPYKDEIIALLKNGSPKTFVARKYGTTVVNLIHWLKVKGLVEEAKPDFTSVVEPKQRAASA